MLHTHSFIYHRRCIMFFSQYFSFPCQCHSTNAPYSFIHLPPTLYTVFLPVLQFPPSVSFHQCSISIHSSTCCSNHKDRQRSLGCFQNAVFFGKSGSTGYKSSFTLS